MAANRVTETAKVSVTTTDNYATFQGAQQLYLVTDADCFIDFDQPAVANRSLLLKANQAPVFFDLRGGSVGQVHAITASSTANLYIMAAYN